MASREQIRANRTNAGKSTGPRTPEGKAASSRNAVTHGLTADPEVANPGDPTPAYRAGLAEWMDDLKPRGILERTLTERACRAAWRLGKCDRYEDATTHKRERDAAEAFDLEQRARAEALGRRLIAAPTADVEANAKAGAKVKDGEPLAEVDPAVVVAELKMSAAGIDWLIARWEDLARALKRPHGWSEDDEFAAARLLGVRPEEARHHPATRGLFPPLLDPREAEARESAAAAGALRAALEASDAARERGATDPRAIGRRVLAEVMAAGRADAAAVVAPRRTKVVRAERARLLRLRAKGHDARSREDRAGAADRSLFDDARGASLLIRYTTAASRDLHRSIRDLIRLRESSGPDAGPVPDPDGPPEAGDVSRGDGEGNAESSEKIADSSASAPSAPPGATGGDAAPRGEGNAGDAEEGSNPSSAPPAASPRLCVKRPIGFLRNEPNLAPDDSPQVTGSLSPLTNHGPAGSLVEHAAEAVRSEAVMTPVAVRRAHDPGVGPSIGGVEGDARRAGPIHAESDGRRGDGGSARPRRQPGERLPRPASVLGVQSLHEAGAEGPGESPGLLFEERPPPAVPGPSPQAGMSPGLRPCDRGLLSSQSSGRRSER